jgi:multisubunit Na+/H+ antiporter MnhG subunit
MRKDKMIRKICFAIGCICLAIGIFGIIRQLPNLYQVPPILFVGLLWLLFGFLLSRKGPIRRILAFLVGFISVGFFSMLLARAFYGPGDPLHGPQPLPVAIRICAWLAGALISGYLAVFTPARSEGEKPAVS